MQPQLIVLANRRQARLVALTGLVGCVGPAIAAAASNTTAGWIAASTLLLLGITAGFRGLRLSLIVTNDGLVVRNLFSTRSFLWKEIAAIGTEHAPFAFAGTRYRPADVLCICRTGDPYTHAATGTATSSTSMRAAMNERLAPVLATRGVENRIEACDAVEWWFTDERSRGHQIHR